MTILQLNYTHQTKTVNRKNDEDAEENIMTRTYANTTGNVVEELKNAQIEGRKRLTAKLGKFFSFMFNETDSGNQYNLPADMKAKMWL